MTPELGPIYRDFLPTDLNPLRQAAGVDKTIIVQAADTVAETRFLLELAAQTPWVAGVVGWVDMESDDAIALLTKLAADPKFKGIRPMIQDIEDDDWLLRPALDPVFEALTALDLSFDALVLPRHLSRLQRRLEKHPDLRCVINHAAKPEICSGNLEAWANDMTHLAQTTGSFCKLSGLLTEAGDDPSKSKIAPAAMHILDNFGASRVMFGSDWPVLNLASDYQSWIAIAQSLTAHLSDAENRQIFGKTAFEFYNVE